eukprot:355524-Chlamydomonas_euryale.AAC.36
MPYAGCGCHGRCELNPPGCALPDIRPALGMVPSLARRGSRAGGSPGFVRPTALRRPDNADAPGGPRPASTGLRRGGPERAADENHGTRPAAAAATGDREWNMSGTPAPGPPGGGMSGGTVCAPGRGLPPKLRVLDLSKLGSMPAVGVLVSSRDPGGMLAPAPRMGAWPRFWSRRMPTSRGGASAVSPPGSGPSVSYDATGSSFGRWRSSLGMSVDAAMARWPSARCTSARLARRARWSPWMLGNVYIHRTAACELRIWSGVGRLRTSRLSSEWHSWMMSALYTPGEIGVSLPPVTSLRISSMERAR